MLMGEVTMGYGTFLVTVRLIIDWRGKGGGVKLERSEGWRPFAEGADAVNGAEKGVKFNVRS